MPEAGKAIKVDLPKTSSNQEEEPVTNHKNANLARELDPGLARFRSGWELAMDALLGTLAQLRETSAELSGSPEVKVHLDDLANDLDEQVELVLAHMGAEGESIE